MEGLEISEIWNSELERTSRIDSEFYSKENLKIIETLSKHKLEDITQLVNVADGNHLSISDNFLEKGIPYYRGQNIHNIFIEDSQPICIDEETFNLPAIKRSHLKQGDVLLSIVGTIGGVSLVTTNEKATCNCKLAILRPRKIDSYFLFLFLRSKYGQNQIKKFTRGAVQMGLILEDMNQIMIPVFSNTFQLKISERIQAAKSLLNNAKKNLHNAEKVLLDALNIKDDISNYESINIKNISESFLSTGRLDAEYYQKKYEKYTEIINSFLDGSIKIEQACIIADNNFLPMENQIYKYIELANIGKYGDISGYQFCKGSELPTRARRIVHEGDVIVSSIEGSLQSCAIITKEFDKALCSTGFYVIRSNFLNAETLLVLFKSDPIQYLLKQGCSGTILTAINRSEFNNIPIPLIDKTTQIKIADLVKNSFALKQQSEQLLNTAKLAFELAIEEGEEKGLEFMNSITNKDYE